MLALSLATDLGTGRPMEWALQSALLGVRFGAAVGLSDQQLREVYYLALLRFIGCTTEVQGAISLFGDDPLTGSRAMDFIDPGKPREMLGWGLRYLAPHQPLPQRLHTVLQAPTLMGEQLFGHCDVAQHLAERLGFEPSITDALWYIYERWDGKGLPRHIKGEELPLPIRIVHLVQDMETFRRARGAEGALAIAKERAGQAYDPRLAEQFFQIGRGLLAEREDEADWDSALAAEPGLRPLLSEAEFDAAAQVLADFIDLIAPFFARHSRNVAGLAATAARHFGLPDADVKAVERMGWLHDLGKISVTPGLWFKPRPLSSSEWERVRMHPYYTERILSRPPLLAKLGIVASLHHERLDGSGYPRGLRGNAIPPAGLILSAANFYQARIEPRPYRATLTPEAAAYELRRESQAGRMDGDAVKAVLSAAGHHTTPIRRERVAGLSEREIEVLKLVARGLSNRQMAQTLSIAEKTVANHIAHIYEKIDVSTRAGATLFAMEHSLLDDPT